MKCFGRADDRSGKHPYRLGTPGAALLAAAEWRIIGGMTFAFLAMLIGARMQAWAEPTLTHILDSTPSSPSAARTPRLYAARGEWESFQLYVRAGSKDLANLRVEAEGIEGVTGAPLVRRLGYLHVPTPSPRALMARPYWPDVLTNAGPVDLASGETVVYWVTYYIPAEAVPGVYWGKIRVASDTRRPKTMGVRLEVFDFTLPQLPGLSSRFPLDRRAIGNTYGLDATALESWKPVYDALSTYRISFSVWDGGDLVAIDPNGTADAAGLKQHLEYVVPRAVMSCIDVGGEGGAGLEALREADRRARVVAARSRFESEAAGEVLSEAPETLPGGVAGYIEDLSLWLKDQDWGGRAMAEVASLGARERWDEIRTAYEAFGELQSGIARLLTGPPHPYFERYVDRWAVYLPDYAPELVVRLWEGQSLSVPVAPPAVTVSASSCGSLPHHPECGAAPEDAYDGSLFSAWTTNGPPTRNKPEWLALDFGQTITTTVINLFWARGFESEAIEVLTSFDGDIFTAATVNWDHRGAFQPYDQTMAAGTFKYENTLSAVRIVFRGSFAGGPVGVAEVTFEPEVKETMPAPNASIEPWLALSPEHFPSPCADVHPVEMRLIPWICWGQRLAGFVYGGLNLWPEAWADYVSRPPMLWTGGEDGRAFLVYPGVEKPLASARLERLRDGMEDYEYLSALAKAVASGRVVDSTLLSWLGGRLYTPRPDTQELDVLAQEISETRIAIGRALSQE